MHIAVHARSVLLKQNRYFDRKDISVKIHKQTACFQTLKTCDFDNQMILFESAERDRCLYCVLQAMRHISKLFLRHTWVMRDRDRNYIPSAISPVILFH